VHEVLARLLAVASSPSRRHGAHNLFGTASHDGFGRLPAIVVGKSVVEDIVFVR
jgi:hypothetical protein